MKKIYSELSRIQQELKAPKNLFNKFGNYNYRNAEGILESVKPLLNGLALIINDEPVVLGERYYIKATVTLTDGEDSVSAVAYAREDEVKKGMDGCQITGACSSYARKYALNALLMIDDAKDSDDDSLSPKNPDNKPDKKSEKFVNTPVPKGGQVEVVNKLPNVPNPTLQFISTVFGEIRNRLGLTDQEVQKMAGDHKAEFIKAKMIPDKPLKDYSLAEAEEYVDLLFKAVGLQAVKGA
ncbi:MAG: ERF family protein [Acidaminococcaceae bacterium]|nr:ERF family protein [Acidaminococcaceae bacterium]